MTERDASEIRELKDQVKWLTRFVIFLAVMMAINAGLFQIMLSTLFGLLLLLPVLAFTHHMIPQASRQMGRLFSFLSSRIYPGT